MRSMTARLWIFTAIPLTAWGCLGDKPEIIEQKCSACHPSALVYQHKRPMREWDRLLYGMKVRGLKVTPLEETTIRDILASRYASE